MGEGTKMMTIFSCTIVLALTVSVTWAATYKHMGCYWDSTDTQALLKGSHDLDGSKTGMPGVSRDTCVSFCIPQGYPYSGLQAGDTCYCGDDYSRIGPQGTSPDCKTCSDANRCGGATSNDVYYNVDSEKDASRRAIGNSGPARYELARRACIKNGGDLIVPNSPANIQKILDLRADGFNVTAAWVGMNWRNHSGVYTWTDENVMETYSLNQNSFDSYWTPGDEKKAHCVSIILSTGKWQSAACETALPYVCNQPPASAEPNPYIGVTASDVDDSTSQSKRLALFIVLPLFLFCYGGSCILYCVHKIIKNCNRKRPAAKMTLDQMEGGPGREKRPMPYMDNPLPAKRPLSASRRVYPAPIDANLGLNLPTKAMPIYIPQVNASKPMPEYQPDQETCGPATSRDVKMCLEPPAQLMPPPYADEKRARLLENAAREARERRAKDEAEGRPASSPFAGPKREHTDPPHQAESPRDPESPSNSCTGSTANLIPLGRSDKKEPEKKEEKSRPDDGEDRDDNGHMSINEILKKKVQEKKPRKVIAS